MRGAAAALALCAACASYRLLPLPSAPGAMPVRYEKTRLFFHSFEEDGALARVFAGPTAILATVSQPQRGVFASSDGGATWTFSPAPPFDAVLFGGRRIFALASGRVFHSGDEGRSWEGAAASGAGPVEVIALGSEGALYGGGTGQLFASADGGRTFRVLSPRLPAKNWRARGIASVSGAIFISVRGDPETPRGPQARFEELLAATSEEATAAFALADSRDPSPRTFRFGTPGDGVYVSRDGGATFAKTPLMLDAWLVAHQGSLYGIAADPLLQAAALIRRYPGLAAAAGRQLRGDRTAGSTLRAACAFPGLDQLLAGPIASAPIFRSADAGASWSRVIDPAPSLVLALRERLERETPPAALGTVQEQDAGFRAAERTRVMRGRGAQQGQRRLAQTASAEAMLSFVDPARLLAHFNSGLQLTGISQGFAYAPTEAYWRALVDAVAAESFAEGEISLGPGLPDFPRGNAFAVLRERGGAWEQVPGELPRAPAGIVSYPDSIAGDRDQALLVLFGRSRRGQSWRAGWRLPAP